MAVILPGKMSDTIKVIVSVDDALVENEEAYDKLKIKEGLPVPRFLIRTIR